MSTTRIFFLLLSLLCSALTSQAQDAGADEDYEKRIRQQKIGTRYIPADLADAMKTLDALTSEDSKEQYVSRTEDEVVERLFFSFGRWIAINWGLYDGSRFSVYLRKLGVDQPDGQKEFIMRAYHQHLRGESPDVRTLATRYKTQRARADSIKRAQAHVIETFVRPAQDSTRQ